MAHDVADASMATFVLLGKLIETLKNSGVLTEQQTKETIANAMNELLKAGEQGQKGQKFLESFYKVDRS
ncbi:hypothetical protein [Brucella cytisi]|uniref:hypothetical protein n=1 Tax=Brucella cytisi TaxID=407152 RepID=UPI0016B350F0|nr:hypothetical protein [Brucella cytisi]